MARTTHIAFAALALLLLAGCGHGSAPAPAPAASKTAAPAGRAPERTLHVVVQGAKKGASGYYTVTAADGSAGKRSLFSINSRGQWLGNITASPGATVRVALLDPLGHGNCLVTENAHDGKSPHTLQNQLLDVSLCTVVAD